MRAQLNPFHFVLLGLILAAPVLSHAGAALAHSWYPDDCCSDADCRPIASEYVTEQPDGYHIFGGRFFVPRSQARVSPDGGYHGCPYGKSGDQEFPGGGQLRCFFVPPNTM
jgi:hypothetical protein